MKRANRGDVRAPDASKAALSRSLDASADHAGDVERTVLFGSVASGEISVESHVDLLVVWRGPMNVARNVLARILTDILVESGVHVSAHPVSVAEYEKMAAMRTAFFEAVDREGLLVA